MGKPFMKIAISSSKPLFLSEKVN
jgi:hypothetical protein